jgi:hypothetical protein
MRGEEWGVSGAGLCVRGRGLGVGVKDDESKGNAW